MKVGVVLEDENGLQGNVCAHFGQCQYFLIADIDKDKKRRLQVLELCRILLCMAEADVLRWTRY
jgi:predicted Fe-Mo cluster-binding NifX family protein